VARRVLGLLLGGLLLPTPTARAVGTWAPTTAPDVDRDTLVTSATLLRDSQILVAISALSGIGEPPRGTVAAYDPATDRWAERGPFPMLQGHASPAPR